MSITNSKPSEKAFRLAMQLADEVNDPDDLIDITIILTLYIHEFILKTEGVEEARQFLDKWIQVIRHDVKHVILKEEE
jgi:hypothetical protein